jgi:alpha-tubulin suppressor-like RCC1 family protein
LYLAGKARYKGRHSYLGDGVRVQASRPTTSVGARGSRWRVAAGAVVLALSTLVPALASVSTAGATPLLTNLSGFDAAGDHTCAITGAGVVDCWGDNAQGQLGDGTRALKAFPHAVSTTTGMTGVATAVVLGFNHTCALVAGGAWCWGLNDHGEVGNGHVNVAGVVLPDNVSGLASGVTQLAGGGQHTCALLSTEAVKCWGRNDIGQLGNGSAGASESSFIPAAVTGLGPGSGVTSISAAVKQTCVVKSGGVLCWGLNDSGAIGDNTVVNKKVPTQVVGLTSGVTQVALGSSHACALVSGAVKCWGLNSSGQLGNNSTAGALTPVPVTGLSSGVKSIAAGGSHTCAITSADVLMCWGLNSNGQIGDGTTTVRKVPVAVPVGPASVVTAVTAGRRHTCLTLQTGGSSGSKCWGDNAVGQLGSASLIELHGPFLPDPPGKPAAAAGNTTAKVTWTPPPSNGGFAVDSYRIVSQPSSSVIDVSAAVLTANFTGLHNGTKYAFFVIAHNSIGYGGPSSASNTVIPAGLPGAPTQLRVATSDQAATLSWRAGSSNGSAPKSQSITVSPGGKVVTTSGSATTARIAGLKNGATYTFKIRARNRVGSGPFASVKGKLPVPKSGYWMLGANGSVFGFGASHVLGTSPSYPSWASGNAAVAISPRRDGKGYWVVDAAGGVHAFGTAKFYGDHPALRAGEQVSSIAATPSSRGYYLFTNRGRAVVYGDAKFFGDMSKVVLNGPVIASNATPTGRGYFMVASDGGVFSFGDARFHGSTGGLRLNRPVVGLSPTPSNGGYWLVASDGGVFAFGDASFRGSMGAVKLNRPVNGLVPLGNGYLMVASDGGVFNFSNKPFYGSLAASPPPAPIIGIAAFTF